jgi:predicted RNase H-like nuclease
LTADTLIPERQRMVVGADGYPGGWVLYSINVQSFATQVEVTHDLASLLRSRPADMAALGIDVPIGSLDRPRACDLAARKLLGVRGCCVFPAPSRAAVFAEHYRQASDLNEERTGRRLSMQSWGIVPKIRQVDEAMSTESQTWAFEVHPEVSFWKLNQHHPMRYRKTAASTVYGYIRTLFGFISEPRGFRCRLLPV